MSSGAPWSVKGIDPKAREIAKDLARRSGMTLGEWLNQIIMEDGPEVIAHQPQPIEAGRRRFDQIADAIARDRFASDRLSGDKMTDTVRSAAERPAPPVQRPAAQEDDLGRIAEALDRLSARIESSEHRSTLAISGIDQSVVGVLSRIEAAERQQNQVAGRLEDKIEDVRDDQQIITERLRELETARTGARSAEALKSLEGALTRVAGHLYDGEGRTREALAELKRDVDGLHDRVERVDRSNDPGGASALIEQVVARIADRLEQAEARTAQALQGLEGSFAHLDGRLSAAEDKLGNEAPIERRFEALAADLTEKVELARSEMAERMKNTADSRFDQFESALREMTGHVQAAEHRSAQAIEKMGQDVVRMTDSLSQKVDQVEQRNAQSGSEMTRIADAVESRMKRADTAQAEALEKLGTEIARITERLAERMANAERRSAQSMDDVGEQISRVTDRLQQRQERSSSELIDRMRQSEERTAKLLDDAREKIDQRLAEVAKRAADQPAPAPAAYPDPFAAADFAAHAYGEPFSAFGGQGFPGQPFPAPTFTAPAEPQHYSSEAPAEDTSAADPFALPAPNAFADFGHADPFAHATDSVSPEFAPEDIEAAEEFSALSGAYAQETEEPVSEAEETHDVQMDHADHHPAQMQVSDDKDPFDQAGYEGAFGEPAPLQDPASVRSASTRDLIAQARAAARAASQPPESKSGRRGGGGKAKEEGSSSSLFSGFGFGRKKAKAENSTLKTALLMSAAAAFLGIGTAGFVLQNGTVLAGWANGSRAPGKSDPGVKVAMGKTAQPAVATAAAPLDPHLALAMAPSATMAPAAPPPEAQNLYNDAVAQIESGDATGLEALRKSANLGYAPAQYYLAKLYEDGKGGLKKDVPEARRWTERAAANGEPRAMHNLATFYYYGEGGPQNSAAAVDWFKKAANLGWVDSQFNLAVMNEKGLGVRQNAAEAYKWYVIAARGGDDPSRGKSAELKKVLSPAELASADRAADSFRAESPNPSARAAAAQPSTASAVIGAQRALARLGYYQGPADGQASPALRLAIAAYQRDQGLATSGALTPELAQRFATATR